MRKILPYLIVLLSAIGLAACVPQGGGVSQQASQPEQVIVLENPQQDFSPASDAEVIIADAKGEQPGGKVRNPKDDNLSIRADGKYTDKDRVALYIHTYAKLPQNYIRKRDAEALGWVSSAGNLHEVAPGMSIGGDNFGNYEGQLPKAAKRRYYECDIDYGGGRRNAKRIVYSSDGLIFYTGDHYKSFTQLY